MGLVHLLTSSLHSSTLLKRISGISASLSRKSLASNSLICSSPKSSFLHYNTQHRFLQTSTLLNMPPKQSTLGSFFKLPPGTKPPVKQQTKLTGKSEEKTKSKSKKDEAESSTAAAVTPEAEVGDVEMEDIDALEKVKKDKKGKGKAAKKDKSDTEAPVKKTSKKRSTDDDDVSMDDASDGDAAPVRKRRRNVVPDDEGESPPPKTGRKATSRSKSKKAISDEESSRPESPKVEEKEQGGVSDAEMASPPPADSTEKKTKTCKASPKPKNEAKKEVKEEAKEMDDEEGDEAPAKPKREKEAAASAKVKKEEEAEKEEAPKTKKKGAASAKTKSEEEVVEEMVADDFPESESEAEEDKPLFAPSAYKEVQKALTAKAMHPYPDWKPGSPVPYAALCKTFELIEGTTKRLQKLAHTTLFLRQVLRLTPEGFLEVVHLVNNKLAADYEGIELGIGESLLVKAVSQACGRSLQQVKNDQNELGDLGVIAAKSRQGQKTLMFKKPTPLTVSHVHKVLLQIATTKGEGCQGRKVDLMAGLLAGCVSDYANLEAKYLVRGLEGKLRIGLADKNVQVSIAQAVVTWQREKDNKKVSTDDLIKAEAIMRSVYSELPSYDVIIPELMKTEIWNLKDVCKLKPGVPLKPMLANPTKSISEVLDRFTDRRFTCEYKYDGERAQIHFVSKKSHLTLPSAASGNEGKQIAKGVAKIFSRNSEDLSGKYPDVLELLDTWIKPDVDSFVIDCEAVAWDRVENKILPFQQLMTRKKKDVATADVKVRVCIFAFDLLYLNGKSMCKETLEERRRHLHECFTEVPGEFQFATFQDAKEVEAIQAFLDESVKASCEGLMVKMLDGEESGYEPSKRSRNWLKIKKDYLSGVGDSLDLVVVGAYHGKGKRTSKYGAYLLACYNPSKQTYETICNIGTGFSDEDLDTFYELLSGHVIDRPKPFYSHSKAKPDQPDVWFEPAVVWEVKTADLTLSPKYRAAEGLADTSDKGVSLRFPRLVRIRDDKTPEQATNSRQVAELYRNQESVSQGKKGGVDDDFEY